MQKQTHTIDIAGKSVDIITGDIAFLAQGSVRLQMGGTVLHAAVAVANQDADLDYFPLSVEYIEKMYARGAMSGSRFSKRDGRPTDEAVIKAREVDHSIRSLFPKSWKRPVAVTLTVLAYDGINDPQALTVLGASLALMQSGVPFQGPAASVIVGINQENEVVINPDAKGRHEFLAEWIVSAVNGKILSLEGWGKEVSNEKMDEVLDKAIEAIENVNKHQNEWASKITKTMNIDVDSYDNKPAPDATIQFVKDTKWDEIEDALFNDKVDRMIKISEVKSELNKLVSESEDKTSNSDFKPMNIDLAVEYVARRIVRDAVLNDNKRVSNRKLNEVRELKSDIDILPTVHGSALFSRGVTQSLSIVTLAPKSSEMTIDDMEGMETKTFMHEYNFPPYSTGETGKFNYYPGRREIGHGMIGENALKNIVPSTDVFPYTIRVVSEIMSSNGSTSMAATCASSMALMAAGVPMKSNVAGIGVGLVTEDGNEDNYKLLLDIEGLEDFYGDMDFKVCGTKDGITAIQYENKLQGVKPVVLKEAIRLAFEGRLQVLEVMNKAIAEARKEVAKNAPKVETMKINQERIGELIGPGGKNIRELVESATAEGETAPNIDIDNDGTVSISAVNAEQMDFIKNSIAKMFEEAEVGQIYTGFVDKIVDFGAFIDVSQNISGLVHKSEISADSFVQNVGDFLKEGQKVNVKVKAIERGKISFTMKGVEQPE
jgi:polyribonucleotide nucleotidyltransferase